MSARKLLTLFFGAWLALGTVAQGAMPRASDTCCCAAKAARALPGGGAFEAPCCCADEGKKCDVRSSLPEEATPATLATVSEKTERDPVQSALLLPAEAPGPGTRESGIRLETSTGPPVLAPPPYLLHLSLRC